MDKTIFRKKAIWRLKNINRSRAILYDKIIIFKLKHLIKNKKPKSVMIYIPMKIEADITPIIKELRKKGVAVYVPFMEGESFRLVKYRLPLKKKRFGIYEPKFSRQYRKKDIDIAIVPIIGIDKEFKRVGFGKGMYDRFFQKNNRYIKNTIFIQRVLCYSFDTITNEHDISANTIITSKCTIKNSNKKLSYRHRKILNSIS